MMYELTEYREQLKVVRDRYLRETEQHLDEGYFGHLRECRILHPNPERDIFFCSCGFLYDLSLLNHDLASMIWPDREREIYSQDKQRVIDGEFPPPDIKENWEKSEVLLFKIFGAPEGSEEEIIECHNEYKKLIQEVFGKTFLDSLPTDRILKEALATRHRLKALELSGVERPNTVRDNPVSLDGQSSSLP